LSSMFSTSSSRIRASRFSRSAWRSAWVEPMVVSSAGRSTGNKKLEKKFWILDLNVREKVSRVFLRGSALCIFLLQVLAQRVLGHLPTLASKPLKYPYIM
jgi:hypothetical protein